MLSGGRSQPAPLSSKRAKTWFWVFASLGIVYGAVFFAVGIGWILSTVSTLRQHDPVEWQTYTLIALMLAPLPLVLIGLRRARLASRLLAVGALLTLAQAATTTSSTGDGFAAGLIGAIGFLGAPMLLLAVLFFWRSRWSAMKPQATLGIR